MALTTTGAISHSELNSEFAAFDSNLATLLQFRRRQSTQRITIQAIAPDPNRPIQHNFVLDGPARVLGIQVGQYAALNLTAGGRFRARLTCVTDSDALSGRTIEHNDTVSGTPTESRSGVDYDDSDGILLIPGLQYRFELYEFITANADFAEATLVLSRPRQPAGARR